MAANMLQIITFVACFLFFTVEGQNDSTTVGTTTPITTTTTAPPTDSPTDIPKNTDITTCTCDLTFNACDVNCCCDEDCSTEDRNMFSFCVDDYTAADSQTCVKNHVIIINNAPYETTITDDGLLCIQHDNYQERNYYSIPEVINGTEEFDEYKATYGSFSYQSSSQDNDLSTEPYKSGDPVYTVYDEETVGLLGIAAPMNTKNCEDSNPAAFLYDQSFTCIRPLTSLQEECQTNQALSAKAYYEGFKVITNPEVFKLIIGNDTDLNITENNSTDSGDSDFSIYNSSYAIVILPTEDHICISDEGLLLDCNFTDSSNLPEPSLTPNGDVCENVVVKMNYILSHNGSSGLVTAKVTFTFSNIKSSDLPLTQNNQVTFQKYNQGTDVFERSGNPGYVFGQPVLAGTITSITDADTGAVRHAIEVDRDRNNWLTIVKSTVDGTCSNETDNRASVTFGDEMRSGCNLRVSLNNLTDYCKYIQQAAKNALLGPIDLDNLPYIATFGNSNVEKVGDWVQFHVENAPSGSQPPQNRRDVCNGISLGLHMEIAYSMVGALSNPQPRIVGAMLRFADTQDIKFQCVGPFCQPGTDGTLSQAFEVVSSVQFIDISKPATGISAEKPTFTARLPTDFFYPFT